MATPKSAPPALLFTAIFSQSEAAIDWVAEQCEHLWGKIALTSPSFDHNETTYYEREMGSGLRKQFFVFDGLFDPAGLAVKKLESNELEQRVIATSQAKTNEQAAAIVGSPGKLMPGPLDIVNLGVVRPVNIDPGYITLSKLVLASAKDRAHRIYLDQGIYAEECLYYLAGKWHARPWTYPDYQRAEFHAFFSQAREMLKSRLKG